MTTPDHHPYLTENDLRTPKDSADFLRAWRDSHNDWLEFGDAIDMLDERIERERRQACRRGALENWRNFAQYARWCKERGAVPKDENEVMVLRVLAKAIAFRAAARQP